MIKNKKIIISLFSIFFAIMIFSTKSEAVSANISASATNVEVGTEVTITTTIKGAAWQVNLTGAISQSYADNTDDAEDATITKTAKFTPTSAGNYTIKLSGNVTGSNDNVATGVSDSITITAKEKASNSQNNNGNSNTETPTTPTKKSNNANLKNLGITPNDFKGFKSGTTAYNVTVPNDVESVKIYATLQDSKATVSGTGKQKLNIGKNALNVIVTAEDGTKKTYTINVTREEAKTSANETNTNVTDNSQTEGDKTEEENKDNQKEPRANTSNSNLVKLEIKGNTLTPEFSPDIYEYKLSVNGDISNLDVVTEGANHSVNVEVVGNNNLKDGENIITVLVYNEETKENSTYQIVVTKTNIDLEGLNTTLNDAVRKANKIRYILLGILIFVIVCIIIFIIVKHKYKANNGYEKYDYDEEDKEKLNLDEEEEFFSRVNKEKIEEPEEKEVITTVSNSIVEDNREETELTNTVEFEKEDEEETGEEYFRISKSKRKGKHF